MLGLSSWVEFHRKAENPGLQKHTLQMIELEGTQGYHTYRVTVICWVAAMHMEQIQHLTTRATVMMANRVTVLPSRSAPLFVAPHNPKMRSETALDGTIWYCTTCPVLDGVAIPGKLPRAWAS